MRFALCVLAVLVGSPAVADTDWVTVDRVVAVVDHQIVLASEVELALGANPDLAAITDPEAKAKRRAELWRPTIDLLIETALFRQQAERARITVEPAEVDAAVAEVKKQNQIDDAQLADALAAQHVSMAQWRASITDQLLQLRLINIAAQGRIKIDDAQVKAAYDDIKAKAGAADVPPFDKVKDDLRQKLYGDALAGEASKMVAEWRAAAYVEVRE